MRHTTELPTSRFLPSRGLGWGWGLALTLVALLAFPTSSLAAAEEAAHPVTLDVSDGRWLRLALPPSILEDGGVAEELTSGLTTTFAFTVEPRGGGVKRGTRGGARIEIRYHLWDEAFHCSAHGLGMQTDHRILTSREALRAWWKSLRLRALDLEAGDGTRPRQVRVTLDVIPFSSQEEQDTQRWLGEALGREGRSPSDVEGDEGPAAAIGQVFNVLIATSIRRQASTSYRWTLPVPGGAPP